MDTSFYSYYQKVDNVQKQSLTDVLALIRSYFGPHFSRIFSHSDWIRRDTKYLSVFSPNTGKCGKNTDQNKSEYGQFLRSECSWHFVKCTGKQQCRSLFLIYVLGSCKPKTLLIGRRRHKCFPGYFQVAASKCYY